MRILKPNLVGELQNYKRLVLLLEQNKIEKKLVKCWKAYVKLRLTILNFKNNLLYVYMYDILIKLKLSMVNLHSPKLYKI